MSEFSGSASARSDGRGLILDCLLPSSIENFFLSSEANHKRKKKKTTKMRHPLHVPLISGVPVVCPVAWKTEARDMVQWILKRLLRERVGARSARGASISGSASTFVFVLCEVALVEIWVELVASCRDALRTLWAGCRVRFGQVAQHYWFPLLLSSRRG